MILTLPYKRNSILFFKHVCSVQGESHVLMEHYLKWEWVGGFGRFGTGGVIIWVLPWSLLFRLGALSYAKAIIVHWLANQWVTLCKDWYLLKRNLPN